MREIVFHPHSRVSQGTFPEVDSSQSHIAPTSAGSLQHAFSTNRCTARPRRHVPTSFLFRSWEKYPTVEVLHLSPIRCASLLVRWGVCVSHHAQNLTQPSGGVTARRPDEPTSDRVSKRRKRTSGTSPPHHWPKEQAVNTNGRRRSKKPNLSRLDQSPPGST